MSSIIRVRNHLNRHYPERWRWWSSVMATEITGSDPTGLLSVGLFEERRLSNTS